MTEPRLDARTVAILLTPAEIRAFISAANLHRENSRDDSQTFPYSEVNALNRVMEKIRHAQQGPPN